MSDMLVAKISRLVKSTLQVLEIMKAAGSPPIFKRQ
jgi:hypothetical protein